MSFRRSDPSGPARAPSRLFGAAVLAALLCSTAAVAQQRETRPPADLEADVGRPIADESMFGGQEEATSTSERDRRRQRTTGDMEMPDEMRDRARQTQPSGQPRRQYGQEQPGTDGEDGLDLRRGATDWSGVAEPDQVREPAVGERRGNRPALGNRAASGYDRGAYGGDMRTRRTQPRGEAPQDMDGDTGLQGTPGFTAPSRRAPASEITPEAPRRTDSADRPDRQSRLERGREADERVDISGPEIDREIRPNLRRDGYGPEALPRLGGGVVTTPSGSYGPSGGAPQGESAAGQRPRDDGPPRN